MTTMPDNGPKSDYTTAQPVASISMYKVPAGYHLMQSPNPAPSQTLARIADQILTRAIKEKWPMPSDLYFIFNGNKYIGQYQIHGPNSGHKERHRGVALYAYSQNNVGAAINIDDLADKQTPKTKVKISENEILQSIKNEWSGIFGQEPTIQQVITPYCQLAMETGHGNECFNYNVGNIIWTKQFPGKFYLNRDSTSRNGNPADREWKTVKFRSYNSLDEGVKDYLKWIKSHKGAASAVMSGDPKQFSRALGAAGYYDPHMIDDFTNKDGKKQMGNTSGAVSIFNALIKKHEAGKLDLNTPSQNQPNQEDGLVMSTIKRLLAPLVEKMKEVFAYDANIMIECIGSIDMSSKIEFASILKQAMKEELGVKAFITIDGRLACSSNRKQDDIRIICEGVSEAFTLATTKIGGVCISPNIIMGSTKQNELNIEEVEKGRRRFRMKFIGAK